MRVAYRKRLEAKRSVGDITIDELLDLGALYDDAGPEDPYLEVYNEILKRDPQHVMGRIWLAFHSVMLDHRPGFMETGLRLIDGLIPLGGEAAAAGYYLLFSAYLVLPEYGVGERVAVLEKSVAFCPEWHSNCRFLAAQYGEQGRHREAVAQLEAALENLYEDFYPYWRPQKRLWESAMTLRVISRSSRERTERALMAMREKAGGTDEST